MYKIFLEFQIIFEYIIMTENNDTVSVLYNNCYGNGECLIQCECECYNEKTDEYNEICICGHREHNGYCPSNCCLLIECRNYKFCNIKQPKWVSNCPNGMCANCAIQMGKHTFTNQISECCVSQFE